ncbi:MAG: hypothetical protein ABS98_13865 [Lysobacteraceae bacterium SCN 69-48]|nr:MAG: hypothetical protein ABS98_13865 [Xanthomonadaceae bacterium SCN 69-48]
MVSGSLVRFSGTGQGFLFFPGGFAVGFLFNRSLHHHDCLHGLNGCCCRQPLGFLFLPLLFGVCPLTGLLFVL